MELKIFLCEKSNLLVTKCLYDFLKRKEVTSPSGVIAKEEDGMSLEFPGWWR